MTAAKRVQLGDAHNFGRRVTISETQITKPRTLLWEWLLLSATSPLRQLLAAQSTRDFGADAFSFLPDLAFSSPHAREGGEVQRIELRPLGKLSKDRKRELSAIVGRALALFSWLGVSDLHWENLVLGSDAEDHIVFTPLDIEMILADLALPTETKLLPDADPEVAVVCQHAAGVRRVLPYLGKPLTGEHLTTVAGAYLTILRFLDRHAKAIAAVFTHLPQLQETPIRLLLRGTDDYVRALTHGPADMWPPLLDAETEQLARGDIPYFFRLYGKRGIHHYGNKTLTSVRRLPLTGDVPVLDPMLDLARNLASPSRTKLREDGLFTVIGAFDHPSIEGFHENDEVGISFKARTLVVRPKDGDELHSRRNLSAFVSSVYLPCSCGETRTVFVPAVTVCDAPRT